MPSTMTGVRARSRLMGPDGTPIRSARGRSSEAGRRQDEQDPRLTRAGVLVPMGDPAGVADRVPDLEPVLLLTDPQVQRAFEHQETLFVRLMRVRLCASSAAGLDDRHDDLEPGASAIGEELVSRRQAGVGHDPPIRRPDQLSVRADLVENLADREAERHGDTPQGGDRRAGDITLDLGEEALGDPGRRGDLAQGHAGPAPRAPQAGPDRELVVAVHAAILGPRRRDCSSAAAHSPLHAGRKADTICEPVVILQHGRGPHVSDPSRPGTPQPGRQRSYWLRDALADEPDPIPLPPPSEPTAYDVVVIGGGYTGLWTAYFLTEADPAIRIAILEQDICGGGSSGRNGGFLHGWWDQLPLLEELHGPDEALDVARAVDGSVDGIREFCERHGVDAWLRGGGY